MLLGRWHWATTRPRLSCGLFLSTAWHLLRAQGGAACVEFFQPPPPPQAHFCGLLQSLGRASVQRSQRKNLEVTVQPLPTPSCFKDRMCAHEASPSLEATSLSGRGCGEGVQTPEGLEEFCRCGCGNLGPESRVSREAWDVSFDTELCMTQTQSSSHNFVRSVLTCQSTGPGPQPQPRQSPSALLPQCLRLSLAITTSLG